MIKKLYHGTGSMFDRFDQNKARLANDYYGGGVGYFTDSKDGAKNYAKAMSKKTGTPYIMEVTLEITKLFDVDDEFTGRKFLDFIRGYNVEQFARDAGLLNYGVDKFLMLGDIKKGTLKIDGDKIFRGISNKMMNTSKAKKIIHHLGYDALKYNAGQLIGSSGNKQEVYIAYDANKITINKVEKI